MGQTILPEIDAVACSGCGDCLLACTAGALALRDGKAVLAHPERCEYDGSCEPVCPEAAIRLPYVILFSPS